MINNYTKPLFFSSVFFLTGCSSMIDSLAKTINTGESEYICKSSELGGLRCKSAREVYKITGEEGYTLERYNARLEAQARQNSGARNYQQYGNRYQPNDHYQSQPYLGANNQNDSWSTGGSPSPRRGFNIPQAARGPLPIRTTSHVMRIWISPWDDDRGDLHVPGYVYTEIEPRKWQIGRSISSPSSLYHPVQTKKKKPVLDKAKQQLLKSKNNVPLPKR